MRILILGIKLIPPSIFFPLTLQHRDFAGWHHHAQVMIVPMVAYWRACPGNPRYPRKPTPWRSMVFERNPDATWCRHAAGWLLLQLLFGNVLFRRPTSRLCQDVLNRPAVENISRAQFLHGMQQLNKVNWSPLQMECCCLAAHIAATPKDHVGTWGISMPHHGILDALWFILLRTFSRRATSITCILEIDFLLRELSMSFLTVSYWTRGKFADKSHRLCSVGP